MSIRTELSPERPVPQAILSSFCRVKAGQSVSTRPFLMIDLLVG